MGEKLKNLSKARYNICFLKGTEPPFSGKYNKHFQKGKYLCVACGEELFSWKSKFDSETGWPSFSDVIDKGRIRLEKDTSLEMVRTEVLCANCGSHLGHVFTDGPAPTGLRYCVNSLALQFKADH